VEFPGGSSASRRGGVVQQPGAKNQVTNSGYSYDGNGNLQFNGNYTAIYNLENRVVYSGPYGSQTVYAYDPWGKRVMVNSGGSSGTYTWTFYGIMGQPLAMVQCDASSFPGYPTCAVAGQNVYFGKRMIVSGGVNVVTDRLGTIRANSQGESFAYYPYGDERTNTVNARPKFGTYFRDAVGQDYADQRYYGSGTGGFWSADPGGIRTASLSRPSSLNRYAYVEGDPVNFVDGHGRARQGVAFCVNPDPNEDTCLLDDPEDWQEYLSSGPLLDSSSSSDSNTINIKKYTTISAQALTVQNDLRWLQAAIAQHPDCASFLVGFNSAIDYMLDVPGSGATTMGVGVGAYSTKDNANAGSTGTNLPAGATITVNTNGAFFQSGPSTDVGYGVPSWITGGSNAAQALILLHELAHNLDIVDYNQNDGRLPDGSPNQAGGRN